MGEHDDCGFLADIWGVEVGSLAAMLLQLPLFPSAGGSSVPLW